MNLIAFLQIILILFKHKKIQVIDMFPRTHQTISNLVFSVYTTPHSGNWLKRLWMCFREQSRT